eukprot:54246-Pelagomonas_calceolata.AAC.2
MEGVSVSKSPYPPSMLCVRFETLAGGQILLVGGGERVLLPCWWKAGGHWFTCMGKVKGGEGGRGRRAQATAARKASRAGTEFYARGHTQRPLHTETVAFKAVGLVTCAHSLLHSVIAS